LRGSRRSLKSLTTGPCGPYCFTSVRALAAYCLSIPANRRTPSSAHTYRLLVVKELNLVCPAADGPGLRSVVFVSSREMRLCGVWCRTSIAFRPQLHIKSGIFLAT
jgi:hypothetical protein